jgi:hypothetical protein
MYHGHGNHFRHTQWYTMVAWVCAECTIGSEIILDAPDGTPRCTVCAEHTIGLEIILDALDGTPR